MPNNMQTYEEAVDRLRDEMAQRANHPGVAVIGEYLTDRLQRDHSLAAQVCADGKSLQGAFDAIRDYASKHKNGSNWAYVPPEKAFAIACEYYGIPADDEKKAAQTLAETPPPADDGLSLDALLGL